MMFDGAMPNFGELAARRGLWPGAPGGPPMGGIQGGMPMGQPPMSPPGIGLGLQGGAPPMLPQQQPNPMLMNSPLIRDAAPRMSTPPSGRPGFGGNLIDAIRGARTPGRPRPTRPTARPSRMDRPQLAGPARVRKSPQGIGIGLRSAPGQTRMFGG